MRRACAVAGFAILSLAGSIVGAAPDLEFWAVLSSRATGSPLPLSILVGNPDSTRTATVVVENETGVVASAPVAPGEVHHFDLGSGQVVSRTALLRSAYRVRSDLPIHAYQFVDYLMLLTYTSASMVAPASAFGTSFMALSMAEPIGVSVTRPSVVTVVARGPARVMVTPSVATQGGGAVPALNAGDVYTVDLQAFDVLQIAGVPTVDMTGTTVSATSPVEVFAGCHACHIGPSAAEDVQDLQIPLPLWGTDVVAVSSNPLTTDVNLWRILASQDGTVVTTDPAMPGTPATIDAGRFLEFSSTVDFHVTASLPVQVGRFNNETPSTVDPALCLMLPAGLFATGATFALPNADPGLGVNWLDVVARPGTTVLVDGVVVPAASFQPVGASGFLHAQVVLAQSQERHSVEADCPVGAYAGVVDRATTASFPVDMTPGSDTPPGELSRSVPLLLAKQLGDVLFSWEDLGGAPLAYNVYEGTLRSIWSHDSLACAELGTPGPAGRRSTTLTPGAGSRYYLMTASSCVGEGPSGADPAGSTCPP